MLNLLKKLMRDTEGQDFVEYAMLLSGIVLLGYVGMSTVGGKVAAMWTTIGGLL